MNLEGFAYSWTALRSQIRSQVAGSAAIQCSERVVQPETRLPYALLFNPLPLAVLQSHHVHQHLFELLFIPIGKLPILV